MLLTDARRDARVGADGELVLLAEQDRGALGARADRARPRARPPRRGRGPAGPYTVQAAIAAEHARAGAAADDRLAADRPPLPVAGRVRPLAGRRAQPRRRRRRGRGAGGGPGDHRRDRGARRLPALHAARAELLRRTGEEARRGRGLRACRRAQLEPGAALVPRSAAGPSLARSRSVARIAPELESWTRSSRRWVEDPAAGVLGVAAVGVSAYHSAPNRSRPLPFVSPGLDVARIEVERVAVVGDLLGAVVALDRPEQRSSAPLPALGLARRRHGRPGGSAVAAAVGLPFSSFSNR